MKRPNIDTIECFFLIAIENSTTMSKAGIDSVLGLVEYAKLQESRVAELEDLCERVATRRDLWQRSSEESAAIVEELRSAQEPRPMSEAPRDGTTINLVILSCYDGEVWPIYDDFSMDERVFDGWLPSPAHAVEKSEDA